jgi:arylsulfatase A-like enzyme
MSDNGIAFGEHRWTYKTVPYEESIRLPLVVRYDAADAAAAGTGSTALVSNIDIAPTIADAAGIGSTFTGVGTVDGSSMLPLVNGSATSIRSRLLLEHLDYSPTKYHVPAYCGLRTSHLIYVRYGDGFEEVYRLDDDPYELQNVVGALTPERLGFLRSTTRALCDPLPPGYSWP